MQKSAAFLMVTVLLLGLLLLSESRRAPVARVDRSFADWIAANTTLPAQQAHVALVEINESSLDSAHPWPWSPLEYALFIHGILSFTPDVVAIEPALSWENTPGAAAVKQRNSQKILHDYILKTPKLILGSQLGFPDDPEVVPPLQQVPFLRNIRGDASAIPEFTAITQQAAEDLRMSATAVAFTNVPHRDTVVHKAPLVFRYRGQIVPSLALQAAILWFKLTPDDVVVEAGSRILLGKVVAIPIDPEGRMDVNFGAPVARFGYDDLLLAVDQKGKAPAIASTAVNGGIAILARTDKESRTLFFPTANHGSSGELFARAVATIQSKAFLRRVPYTFDFAVIALMMAFSCFFHRFRKRAFLLLSLFLLLGYLMLGMSVFALSLIWLPIALPVGLLLLINFFSIFSKAETKVQKENTDLQSNEGL